MKAHAPKQRQPPPEATPHDGLRARHAAGKRVVPESPHLSAGGFVAGLGDAPAIGFAHDFSRIPSRDRTPISLQTKLTVNTPGDAYEQEADRLSEEVMRMPDARPRRACACGSGCAGCQGGQPREEHERLRTKRVGSSDLGQTLAPPVVREVLASPGRPIDTAARAFLEPRFGHDFGHVRVHTDERAAESARALKARAYTVGNELVFGEGEYSPRTLAGQRLLAHELAHTLQQGAGSAGVVRRQTSLDIALRAPGVAARVFGSETLDGFALNSHTLTAGHKRRLLALAKRLKELLSEHQYGTVEITGHTDATGDDALNDQLGQERADAVADFLRGAGVPALALLAESAGESALRVPTDRAEPGNRRVEIRFLPELPTPAPPTPEPGTAEPAPETGTVEPTPKPLSIPRPENLCAEHPEICDPITTKPEAMQDCRPADCSAYGNKFDRQPPDLQLLLTKSFPPRAKAVEWFEGLDDERRLALQHIFNRLCRLGLLCEVRLVVKVEAGEPPASFMDRQFSVPGLTPSVYFTGTAVKALPQTLVDTGRFCEAHGLGALMHPGGPTLRQISGTDSLHVSVESDGLIEAHIDGYSPVPEHPGGRFCPNTPTPAALAHITRELVPEVVRKGWRKLSHGIIPVLGYLDLAGLQGFPDFNLTPTVPQPEPANRSDAVPPPLVGITLRGPRSKPKRPAKQDTPEVGVLTSDVAERIQSALDAEVSTEALVPPDVRARLAKARGAADKAGPDEETALNKARDATEDEAAKYPDAHDVALDLAVLMEKARRGGSPFVKLEFWEYGAAGVRGGDTRKSVVAEIERMALLLRKHLPGGAAGVNTLVIVFRFEEAGVREEIRLPGWKPREKGLFE
jgi:outer membrane protein OmpA-like peptidoglycan-associated protein